MSDTQTMGLGVIIVFFYAIWAMIWIPKMDYSPVTGFIIGSAPMWITAILLIMFG